MHHEFNFHHDEEEEIDAVTSDSNSNASTPYPPTPRSFRSPPEIALSQSTQYSLTNPLTGAECSLSPTSAIASAIASTTAIAVAAAIASPEATASPTKIKIKQTPKGLKKFLQGDILGILGHKKRSLCPDCGESFSRPQDLKRHRLAKHTNELNYPCPISSCTKRFARSDVMIRHSRTHDGQS
jgi:uncharacterized Zn-finger protein